MPAAIARIYTPPTLPLPAWEIEQDKEDWVVIITPEEEMGLALKEIHQKLIGKLQQMPDYCDQFDDQLTTLKKLVNGDVDMHRMIRHTTRINKVLQKLCQHRAFYTHCMEKVDTREKNGELLTKNYFMYAKAVQDLLSLETAALYTCPPPHYETLIQLGKCALIWKGLNKFINTYLKKERLSSERAYLLCVSFWYEAQAHLTLPFPIEKPDHLADIPPEVLDQALNQAKKPIETPLTLSQGLYTLPFWKHYILAGYQDDPTVQGTALETTCQEISQLLRQALGIEDLPKTWPLLDPKLETEIGDKFVREGLYPLLKDDAIAANVPASSNTTKE
jgi:hypothetical protein